MRRFFVSAHQPCPNCGSSMTTEPGQCPECIHRDEDGCPCDCCRATEALHDEIDQEHYCDTIGG